MEFYPAFCCDPRLLCAIPAGNLLLPLLFLLSFPQGICFCLCCCSSCCHSRRESAYSFAFCFCCSPASSASEGAPSKLRLGGKHRPQQPQTRDQRERPQNARLPRTVARPLHAMPCCHSRRNLLLPLPFLLSFPQGICCCLCPSCRHSRRKSAVAFALLVVIPAGNLLFASAVRQRPQFHPTRKRQGFPTQLLSQQKISAKTAETAAPRSRQRSPDAQASHSAPDS